MISLNAARIRNCSSLSIIFISANKMFTRLTKNNSTTTLKMFHEISSEIDQLTGVRRFTQNSRIFSTDRARVCLWIDGNLRNSLSRFRPRRLIALKTVSSWMRFMTYFNFWVLSMCEFPDDWDEKTLHKSGQKHCWWRMRWQSSRNTMPRLDV